MKARILTVSRTARVFSSAITEESDTVWICLHGYGELASDLFHKITCLADSRTVVVCPEGLSRFYTKGGAGNVGASWMTKESREDEIIDYLKYLDQVFDEIHRDLPSLKSLNILGFSQGAATASRWFSSFTKFRVDHLILWGAVFPPDLVIPESFSNTLKILFAGDSDKYLPQETVNKLSSEFDRVIRYSGGHDIDCAFLKSSLADLKD